MNKKMTFRICSVALILIFAFYAIPFTVLATPTATGVLDVAGTELVTNGAVVDGASVTGAVYSYAENTLYLTDYNGGYISAQDMGSDFAIVLSGTNEVTGTQKDCISITNGSATISGLANSTLTLKPQKGEASALTISGIYCNNADLSISNVTMTVVPYSPPVGESFNADGIKTTSGDDYSGSVTITASSIVMTTASDNALEHGINSAGQITINTSSLNITPRAADNCCGILTNGDDMSRIDINTSTVTINAADGATGINSATSGVYINSGSVINMPADGTTRLGEGICAFTALEVIFSELSVQVRGGCAGGLDGMAVTSFNNSTVYIDSLAGNALFTTSTLDIYGGTTALSTADSEMAAIRCPQDFLGTGNTLTIYEGSSSANSSVVASLTDMDPDNASYFSSACYVKLAGPLINRNSAGGTLVVNGTALMSGGSVQAATVTGATYSVSGNTLTLNDFSGTSVEAVNMGSEFRILFNGESTISNDTDGGVAVSVSSSSANTGVDSLITIEHGDGDESSLTVFGQASAFGGEASPNVRGDVTVKEKDSLGDDWVATGSMTWANGASKKYVLIETLPPVPTGSLSVDGTAFMTDGVLTENTVNGATYDSTYNVLTLEGYDAGSITALNMGTNFSINVVGDNYVSFIDVIGKLGFTGSGNLYVSNYSGHAINVSDVITIDGPNVDAIGDLDIADDGVCVMATDIFVTNGSLSATGGTAAIVTVNTPVGTHLTEGDVYFTDIVAAFTNNASGGQTGFVSKPYASIASDGTKSLMIGGLYDDSTYLTTGYTTVNTSADASGTGWTYTAASNTLALNNYTGGAIVADCMGSDFNITLTGESVFDTDGVEYETLTWNNAGIIIRNTPLTTISGSGSLQMEGTLAIIEGSLTVTDSATLAVGCGEGGEGDDPYAEWYTTKAYDGIAIWRGSGWYSGYVSAVEPTLTVTNNANVTALGYYNGVYINSRQEDTGHLIVSGNATLRGSGEGVNMGVQVEGDVTVTGGLLYARGVVADNYQFNGAYGLLATGGFYVSGGTVIADGYNYGISTNCYDSLDNYLSTSEFVVSGTGCVIATGRTTINGLVTAPAIAPVPNAEAGSEYTHVNVNGLPTVGTYNSQRCIIGGHSVAVSSDVEDSVVSEYERCGASARITVTVTPPVGKRLVIGSLKYSDALDGGNETVITKQNGVYSFIMPDRDIIITAQFVDAVATTVVLTPPETDAVYNANPVVFGGTASVKYDNGQSVVEGAEVVFTYCAVQNGEYGNVLPEDAGTYWVKGTFAGDDVYASSVSDPMSFTIAKAVPTISISNRSSTFSRSTVSVTSPQVSGVDNEHAPTGTVTVTYYKSYTDDTDFVLTTTANSGAASDGTAPVNAGVYYAIATIDSDANYTAASSSKVTVTINAKSITSTMVSSVDNVTYNGLAQTPEPTVRHTASASSTVLTKCYVEDENHVHGTGCNGDYYLVYSNNVNAYSIINGVPVLASVTVYGTGNYKGTITKSFIIQPCNITTNDAILSVTGSWITDGVSASGPVSVTFEGVNGERPVATATGTVASAAGGTYNTVSLSDVAITDATFDNNYYYSDTYTDVTTGVEISVYTVSVTISWGAMEFTYSKGTWNPETLTYSGTGWVPDSTDGNKITVENTGSTDVTVSYGYTQTNTEVAGDFKDSGGNPITNPVSLPAGEKKYAWLTLTGKPTEDLTDATLGTVTVTLLTS